MQQQANIPKNASKVFTGLFLIIAGILVLINRLTGDVPQWLVSWPMAIIAAGILWGINNRFKTIVWLIPVVWGGYLMAQQQLPQLNLQNYSGPVSIIFVGVFFLTARYYKPVDNTKNIGGTLTLSTIFSHRNNTVDVGNYTNTGLRCLGSNMQIKLEGNFMQDNAVLNVNVTMGQLVLTVPPNWLVKNNTTSFMGGINDERHAEHIPPGTAKTIILKGHISMGMLEIYNR